jgi:hypothetical protein
MCAADPVREPHHYRDYLMLLARSPFPPFGLLFLVVGVGRVLSPLRAVHRARGTVYAVTDQRAIVSAGGWRARVRSFGPGDPGCTERRHRRDDSGDITPAREHSYVSGHYSGSPGRGGHYVPGGWRTKEVGFFGVARVESAGRLLRGQVPPRAEPGPPA